MRRRERRSVRLGLALALAALAALLVPAGASASRGQWSLFEDNTALIDGGVKKRIAALDEIKALGPDTLRIEFRWNQIAPSPHSKAKPSFDASDPAAYQGALDGYPGFGQYDDLVLRANAMGFRILATITGDAPRWATAGGKGASFRTANYKVNSVEYARFAEAVARRYAGNFQGLPAIHYFSIWNEPNHKQFLKPLRSAPTIYRHLVDRGLPAIKRHGVHGVRVFVGETAPSASRRRSIGPRHFVQRWLCLDNRWKRVRKGSCRHFHKVRADAYAHHPYGPPTFVSKRNDTVSIVVIRRIAQYIDKAARRGRISSHLPIYDTEFGYQSNPPDPFVSTRPGKQARLLNEKEEYHYRYGRIKSYSQYLLYDDKARSGPTSVRWSGFQTGLRFASGRRKPALRAYRCAIVAHKRRHGVYIWGHVRPGTNNRYVQLYAGGRRYGPRIRTDSRGYFGVKRRRDAKYRYKAYDGRGTKAKLIGTSRTAGPD